MKEVKLVKLSDDVFNGQHPNGIVEGSIRSGLLLSDIKVGSSVLLGTTLLGTPFVNFYTSTVTEIVKSSKKNVIFKTLNSTYKLTYIDKNEKT